MYQQIPIDFSVRKQEEISTKAIKVSVPVPEHQVHELYPLSLEEPLPVLLLQEEGAEAVE
jgi:hypothetical protein